LYQQQISQAKSLLVCWGQFIPTVLQTHVHYTASILDDAAVCAIHGNARFKLLPRLLQVNKYPGQRTFTAIGTGGDDFKATMLAAVEGVVGSVHVECVSQRPSSGGKYLSVRIGPVWVQDADQVRQQQQQQWQRQSSRVQSAV
jgi:putative lipoic acid-binding regulatory protein